MKFDKLKPNLQELNLNGVKKAASRVAHVRIRLSRGQWIGVIAGLVVVTVLLVILLRPRPAAVVLPVVAVEPVTTEDVNIYGDYVGRIRAQQFVEIRARVEGYLEKMLFAEGTYIRKGQTLFVIDPRVYRARVDKAKAQLNKARAQALKAKRDLDRIRPLFEQSAASQLELDNATAAYESAVADVAVGEADLTQAETALSYTTVSSPLSGYISERSVDIGTLVGPNGKSLLATVVKSDTVRVDFSMTGLDYLKSKARNVNLGQKDSTRKWDPYITITLADNTQSVVIEKGGAYIFVIRPDSIAERRLIELGPEVNNRVIVERGVVPGEKIVVEGFHKLTHGDKVDPVPVPEKSSATETEASEK